jgi:HD-like signal output (HDOD) protein
MDRLSSVFSRCDLEHPVFQEIYRVIGSLEEKTESPLSAWPGAGDLEADQSVEEESAPESPSWSRDPRSLIQSDSELVSLPDIYLRIEKVIKDPNSSARHVAAIISQDPNLSVKLLKIVNSAFYGLRQRIDTISRAVTIVGHNQISDLILGTSVMALFSGIPANLMNMNLFWEHSVACGTCARWIAGFRKFPNTESFFVAGLLHDLGKLILFKNLPRQAKAEQWKLPDGLMQAIGGHHPPWSLPLDAEAAIIFVADNLANALRIGTSGENFVSPELTYAVDLLSLPDGIWENLIPLIKNQIKETVRPL